jgi:PPOX class probable FMN-dependent enzyme
MPGIADQSELRSHFGAVAPLAAIKVLPRLDEHARAFIAIAPFLVLATVDADGHADASPRGDAPGFVEVLDDATLLIPDRPGNNRVDSYGNLLECPGVGLLFFVPGIDETLRVNGRARLVTGDDLLARSATQGKIPRTGLVLDIEEVFFHCGKALKRARLWDGANQVERSRFPSLGRIIADQTRAVPAAVADEHIADDYRTGLY